MTFYKESKPIPTDQGLSTNQLKGDNWWAQRWISTLEGLLDAGRLRRGRRYARSGQVLELQLHAGEARALVQGSRSTPYEVRIATKPLSELQWQRVLELLAGRAIFAAQLLSGEVPAGIEGVFAEADAALLPVDEADLEVSCSCPDWAGVCKHAAAVAYLLGEGFDEDPFGLFLLRGRSREQLLAVLAPAADSPAGAAQDEEEPSAAVPLAAELDRFWSGGELPVVREPEPPAVQAQLLRRLGPLAGEKLSELLDRQYRQMSKAAITLWHGEEERE